MAGATTETEDINIIREVIDHGPVVPTQILVVVIALLLNMLDGFDVTAMAFTAHSIGEQLGISPDQLGIVFSVALAGMMIGAMFIAPISDVIGRRNMILICVTAIGTSMYVTGYAVSLWQLVVLRLITGLGVGGMLASLAAITAEYTPEKYRSLAVVSVTAGYPLGAMLGGFIAAPLIPAFGWESVFFAGGAATLAMVIAVYFLMPESLQYLATKQPANALHNFNAVLKRLGRTPIAALPAIDPRKHGDKANVLSLLTEARRGKTINLWLTFFFCFICLYFLMSWIPKLVVNAGLSETQGVYAAVAFNGGAVVGIVCLGYMATRIGLSALIGTFLSTSALGMIIFAFADGVDNLILYLLVIGFLLQGGFTGLYAVAAKIYPTELRSTGVGWAIGLGRFGAVVGPYIGGIMIASDVSMEINFVVFAVPLFIAGCLAYRLRVR
ncbi:MFS transporter [Pseudomaricurvus alcaniphilus]|uniref:MFS transporter n=1 Tax=Pseudomaricurvus alcaniphilus TaxID=1166482 RepID=UPI00140A6315|nr:MFS transporter [Pseudomaricurvus alcaniphilus]NHN36381.1 MFS transporter [Pseudomaricurvus alcaniphilus]